MPKSLGNGMILSKLEQFYYPGHRNSTSTNKPNQWATGALMCLYRVYFHELMTVNITSLPVTFVLMAVSAA